MRWFCMIDEANYAYLFGLDRHPFGLKTITHSKFKKKYLLNSSLSELSHLKFKLNIKPLKIKASSNIKMKCIKPYHV